MESPRPKVTILAEVSYQPQKQAPPNFFPWFHCEELWDRWDLSHNFVENKQIR